MADLRLLSTKLAGGLTPFLLRGLRVSGGLTSLACSGGVSHLLSSSDSPSPPGKYYYIFSGGSYCCYNLGIIAGFNFFQR